MPQSKLMQDLSTISGQFSLVQANDFAIFFELCTVPGCSGETVSRQLPSVMFLWVRLEVFLIPDTH
jgi:hypothetical protein